MSYYERLGPHKCNMRYAFGQTDARYHGTAADGKQHAARPARTGRTAPCAVPSERMGYSGRTGGLRDIATCNSATLQLPAPFNEPVRSDPAPDPFHTFQSFHSFHSFYTFPYITLSP